MSPLFPKDSAVINGGFGAFYNAYLWYHPRKTTRENSALPTLWDRADTVLDPSKALTPDLMPVHTITG